MIARVVTELALDRTFDYKIPPEMSAQAVIGARVRVPFGRTTKTGFIVEIVEKSEFPRLKSIKAAVDPEPLIPAKLVKLGEWIARYYCCSIEQAIKALLPGVIRGEKVRKKTQTFVRLLIKNDAAEKMVAELEEKFPKQALVLKKLVQREETPLATLKFELKISDSAINTLEKKKVIEKVKLEVERNPFDEDKVLMTSDLKLTDEQAECLRVINESQEKPKPDTILLEGVTGSGKTEVYLQAIRRCIELGKEAIVLVPEIALTPQTVERFRSRFGDKVSVLHSGLSDVERFEEWMKIHEDQVQIAVGARSALFAPFQKIGLIIVDEEHEQTYKQDSSPRYHARDVAVLRGHLEHATVVLGSATPSFESKYNVTLGKYVHTRLTKRVDDQIMPEIDVIDLKTEQAMGQKGIFSDSLIKESYRVLNAGQQVMFFLNRRGFSTSMLCMNCGYVAKCESCARPYTYHKKYKQLICHYCNDIHRAYECCPQCKSDQVKYTGLGTERIEDMAQKVFPKARIARMDSDTMGSAKDYERVLNQFRAGQIDILIGTQMIAKGLHFPNVTLVGILLADMGLHIPDFRAGERTLQLITQVAGRAGRGTIPGRVLIQTYTPYHPALQCAIRHDYEGFYEEEIDSRIMFGMPPKSHMIIIHFQGENETLVMQSATQFFESLQKVTDEEEMEMTDPMPSPIEKVDNRFRYQITIRTEKVLKASLILRQAVVGRPMHKNIRFHVDIDAYSLL